MFESLNYYLAFHYILNLLLGIYLAIFSIKQIFKFKKSTALLGLGIGVIQAVIYFYVILNTHFNWWAMDEFRLPIRTLVSIYSFFFIIKEIIWNKKVIEYTK